MTKEQRQAALVENRQRWKERIDRWRQSGASQLEYCRLNDLKYHRFIYWRKKYQHNSDVSGRLVELPFSMKLGGLCASQPKALRIVVGDGVRIEVERNFDPLALRQLLEVFGQP